MGLPGSCGKDIQSQAVLAPAKPARSVELRAQGAERGGIADAVPGNNRGRRSPAQIADWRRGIRDSPKGAQLSLNDALNQSRPRADNRLRCVSLRQHRSCAEKKN